MDLPARSFDLARPGVAPPLLVSIFTPEPLRLALAEYTLALLPKGERVFS